MSEGNGSAPARVLGRDEIVRVDDLPRELVEVPEWDGSVWVRGLTGTERGIWESEMSQITAQSDEEGNRTVHEEFRMQQMRVSLCTMTLCDEKGQRLFQNHEREMVGQKSAAGLQRVFDVSRRLSGISRGSVERAVKSSSATADSGSDTASA